MNLAVVFVTVSASLGIPDGMLSSLCMVESNHRPEAIRQHDGVGHSLGICQIKRNTAALVGFTGTEKDLMRTELNIAYAGRYLRKQYDRYQSWERAAVAYNKGRSDRTGGNVYSRKVLKAWKKTKYPN